MRRRSADWSKEWIDPGLSARAKKGVPIGAGRAGLVRTKLPRRGGPGDRDLDGIPNGIDVDDDGDLILDGYDRPAAASTSADLTQRAQLSSFPDGTSLHLTTMLGWTPYGAVNVNGGSTDEQLAAVQRDGGVLGVEWDVGIDPGSGNSTVGPSATAHAVVPGYGAKPISRRTRATLASAGRRSRRAATRTVTAWAR